MEKLKEGLKTILGILLITLITFSSSATNAHEDVADLQLLEGFGIEFTPTQAIKGDEIPIEAHIIKDNQPATGLDVVFVIDNHDIGLSEKLSTTEREPGHYFTMYNFKEARGAYEVHIEFDHNGEKIRKSINIDIISSGKGLSSYFLLIAALLILLSWYFGLKGKKKKIKRSVIFSIIILALLGIAYSLEVTFQSGARSSGIIVCPQEDKCYWTAHIHAYVPIYVCGKEIKQYIEVGPLNEPHTHEEKHVIHWHDRLPYDNVNKRLLEYAPLTLGAYFDALEMQFDSNRILDKSNDDLCPDGSQGTLKMFVNGKQNNMFRNFVWKDKDVIVLIFDNRSSEQIEEELKNNPIKFPALGRG